MFVQVLSPDARKEALWVISNLGSGGSSGSRSLFIWIFLFVCFPSNIKINHCATTTTTTTTTATTTTTTTFSDV